MIKENNKKHVNIIIEIIFANTLTIVVKLVLKYFQIFINKSTLMETIKDFLSQDNAMMLFSNDEKKVKKSFIKFLIMKVENKPVHENYNQIVDYTYNLFEWLHAKKIPDIKTATEKLSQYFNEYKIDTQYQDKIKQFFLQLGTFNEL